MGKEPRDSKTSSSPPSPRLLPFKDWFYLAVIVLLCAPLLAPLFERWTDVTTMGISQGDRIPSRSLKEENVMEASVNLATIPGKIVIIGVPGAFTPTCSNQVPSFYENAQKFASKGVQGIYVLAVNDAFITKAWKKDLFGENVADILHFLSDDTGEWTKEAGLELDMTPVVGGKRSQRYAAIVEDGILRQIFVEDDPSQITVSHADSVLKHL